MTDCYKLVNTSQTGPDFCQHYKNTTSSHGETASTKSKKPTCNQPYPSTSIDSQSNISIEQGTEVVIIDSSNDEEEEDRGYADKVLLKHIPKEASYNKRLTTNKVLQRMKGPSRTDFNYYYDTNTFSREELISKNPKASTKPKLEVVSSRNLPECQNIIKYFGWAYDDDNEVLAASICLFRALAVAHAIDIEIVDWKLDNYLVTSWSCKANIPPILSHIGLIEQSGENIYRISSVRLTYKHLSLKNLRPKTTVLNYIANAFPHFQGQVQSIQFDASEV
ncbi:hypothetical protein BDF21DRAFT_491338 [Thamnidium elegans]|nr:hypothetical protein BDF21DRAFT_491338 [Thamnidium elegans]